MINPGQATLLFRQSQPVRALFALSLILVVVVVLGAGILLQDLRHKELTHARAEIASLSRILAEQTTRAFDGMTLAMRGVRERLHDSTGHRPELTGATVQSLLQARIVGLPQVKSMFIVDRNGRAVTSSRTDLKAPFNVAQRDFFRHFQKPDAGDLYISQPERARLDGKWTYYLAIPFRDAADGFGGLVVAAVNIGYFEELYQSIGLGSVSRILLLDLDGAVMASNSPDQERLGAVIDDRSFIAVKQQTATGEALIATQHEAGERWYSGYRRVANYPLIVSPSVKESEVLGPWQKVAVPIAISTAMAVIFIASATFMVIMNLLRKERMALALRESDERLRYMVQSVRDAMLTVGASGQITLFNPAAERIFGCRVEDALGQDFARILLENQPKLLVWPLINYVNTGLASPPGSSILAIVSLMREGGEFPVELSLSTSLFHGEPQVTVGLRDLSERLQAEYELVESNRQLQELSAALETVREEERSRISRELHDELGQALTGLRMEVSWLGSRLQALQPEMEKKVASVKKLIDTTIAAVRRISSELRPLVLDDLGFAAAANWYVDQYAARTGIAVRLTLPERDPENGGVVATTLFRVLQESLTNIAKHAEASNVSVRLALADNWWQLSIQDDGVGFDGKIRPGAGIGLAGMKERAQIVGGSFSLTAARGHGTLVEVRLPVEHLEKVRNGEN
ncbi:MAG TPA: cache domain-containing protein [Azonexus sp.]|nr:cache domain-containing protein [Azonexus sp.]